MLTHLPLQRTIALSIVVTAVLLAIAVPAWCFGSGLW